MKSYLTHMSMLILGCIITAAIFISVGINSNQKTKETKSPALLGCEITAGTVEKEPEECRWDLNNCIFAAEELSNRCKEMIENLIKH